jgi:RNA polymerase sigma-70 factor, ECF subfamily
MGFAVPEERELVQELRSGSRAAYERLLDRYERRIYNLALRMLGDAAEAEDAAQDVFVEVHRSLPRFQEKSSLDTWIHRIAVNVCLQRRRKRKLPTVGLSETDLTTRPDEEPLHAAVNGELRAVLIGAVGMLPDPQREVVLLHGMQGLSYSEVAAVLDCPVGTVKSRLSTAFKRLRQLLMPYMMTGRDDPAPAEVKG